MKWIAFGVLGLVGLLVVGALLLVALGRRADAGRLVTSIEVNRPPADVWPWLTQPEKLKQWVSWLVEVRPLTDGPTRPGSRAEWVMRDRNNGDRPMVITSETIAVDAERRLESKLASAGSFEGVASYRLVDLGGGRTRLTTDARYRYHLALAQLMEPLITLAAEKKLNRDFAQLKTLVEAAPVAGPFPAQADAK